MSANSSKTSSTEEHTSIEDSHPIEYKTNFTCLYGGIRSKKDFQSFPLGSGLPAPRSKEGNEDGIECPVSKKERSWLTASTFSSREKGWGVN